jgi:exosortase
VIGNSKLLNLAIRFSPALVASAWLVSYASWYWVNLPAYKFGWIVFLLSIFSVFDSLADLPEIRNRLDIGVSFLYIAGLVSLMFFQYSSLVLMVIPGVRFFLIFGVAACVTANIVQVFGWKGVPSVGFPFYFLFFSLPFPSLILEWVNLNLQMLVAVLNEELLALMGIPAIRQGNIIELTVGAVGVTDGCSGFRSLQSSIMAGFFIGFTLFRSVGWSLVLVLFAVVLAIVGNLGRTLYLCREGALHGVSAIQDVHDAAGWSVLAFTAIGVAFVAWALNRFRVSQ